MAEQISINNATTFTATAEGTDTGITRKGLYKLIIGNEYNYSHPIFFVFSESANYPITKLNESWYSNSLELSKNSGQSLVVKYSSSNTKMTIFLIA